MDLLACPTAQYEALFQTSLHLLFKEVDLGMCCEYYCACVYLTKEYATIYTCISLHAYNGMCFYEYRLVFHSVVISTIKCPCLPYNRTNTVSVVMQLLLLSDTTMMSCPIWSTQLFISEMRYSPFLP